MMNKIVKEMNRIEMVEAENRNEYIDIMIWDDSYEFENDEAYYEAIDKINELIREAIKNGIKVKSYWESEDE